MALISQRKNHNNTNLWYSVQFILAHKLFWNLIYFDLQEAMGWPQTWPLNQFLEGEIKANHKIFPLGWTTDILKSRH